MPFPIEMLRFFDRSTTDSGRVGTAQATALAATDAEPTGPSGASDGPAVPAPRQEANGAVPMRTADRRTEVRGPHEIESPNAPERFRTERTSP